MTKIKIAVAGCLGKMGQEIIKQILKDKRTIFIGGFEHKEHPQINKKICDITNIRSNLKVLSNSNSILENADILIDFTTPKSTVSNIKKCSSLRVGHIIGTTGISQNQLKTIKDLSKKIPVLMSSNMSLGVNLLFNLVKQASGVLKDSDYDIEISETHHKHKVDAPSGTALSLGEYAAEGRRADFKQISVLDRTKKNTLRKKGNIGFSIIRGGEIAGEHTVSFIGPNDRIDLVHKANDRSIFVKGAIEAAIFVSNKKKGFFDMKDLLA